MSDREEIKERVKAACDLSAYAQHDGVTLAGGSHEFKGLCPFHPDKHPSLSIFHKDGAWGFYCFSCHAGGDIFKWIMLKSGCDFPVALKTAANFCSVALPESGAALYKPPLKIQEKVRGEFDPEKYRALTPGSPVYQYLTEKRKLDAGLLVDYCVGETADGLAYAFAYKWDCYPGGRVDQVKQPRFEFAKVVRVQRDERGKKVEWRDPKGGKSILFGMTAPMVKRSHEAKGELVICEGEIDAISWAQYGHAAVSVPGGAGYTGWIADCFDWLAAFSKIYVSFDEDAAGRAKVTEIVTRLGLARTNIVRLPEKEEAA